MLRSRAPDLHSVPNGIPYPSGLPTPWDPAPDAVHAHEGDKMSRAVNSRVWVSLASGALLVAGLFAGAGTSLAADSRNVFFGSPGTTAPGSLTFTGVTVGGATKTDVRLENKASGTLNHVR